MLFHLDIDRPVDDETYVELVRSVFDNSANMSLFGILFSIVVTLALATTSEPLLFGLGLSGVLLALLRVATLLGWEQAMRSPKLDPVTARRAERGFGTVYLMFAALLGMFAGRVFQVTGLELQMLVVALVVGYAAGAAAGMSLRPWICVPAVMLAVVPVVVASVFTGGAYHVLLGLVLALLLAGGIGSMLARYRSEREKIGLRQLFGTLARQDHLTGLANRLALADTFAREAEARGAKRVAIHCLDLDRFKQINDRHGHPAGDQLLQQVAERLRAAIRQSDEAARLGGDEFVVLQTAITHPREAELMAQRIVRTLGEPYLVQGKVLHVGVSVGYTLASGDEDLPQLLEAADKALYRIKRVGGGAAQLGSDTHDNVVRLAG